MHLKKKNDLGGTTKRLNAEIPSDLHKQAKMYAIENGLTLTDLVTQGIIAEIKKSKKI